MIKRIKGFLTSLGHNKTPKSNDFSDFFAKPAKDKAEVLRLVLHEANEEQRKVVKEYRETVVVRT